MWLTEHFPNPVPMSHLVHPHHSPLNCGFQSQQLGRGEAFEQAWVNRCSAAAETPSSQVPWTVGVRRRARCHDSRAGLPDGHLSASLRGVSPFPPRWCLVHPEAVEFPPLTRRLTGCSWWWGAVPRRLGLGSIVALGRLIRMSEPWEDCVTINEGGSTPPHSLVVLLLRAPRGQVTGSFTSLLFGSVFPVCVWGQTAWEALTLLCTCDTTSTVAGPQSASAGGDAVTSCCRVPRFMAGSPVGTAGAVLLPGARRFQVLFRLLGNLLPQNCHLLLSRVQRSIGGSAGSLLQTHDGDVTLISLPQSPGLLHWKVQDSTSDSGCTHLNSLSRGLRLLSRASVELKQ